jgi:hypothetical protein
MKAGSEVVEIYKSFPYYGLHDHAYDVLINWAMSQAFLIVLRVHDSMLFWTSFEHILTWPFFRSGWKSMGLLKQLLMLPMLGFLAIGIFLWVRHVYCENYFLHLSFINVPVFVILLKKPQVNVVADAMRQMSESRKWPLIILHNKHLIGECMKKPGNQKLTEKWKQSNCIYATPTGSNDDW